MVCNTTQIARADDPGKYDHEKNAISGWASDIQCFMHIISDDITFLTFTRTQIRTQSMFSTMKPAQIGGVCIFRTFLYSTGKNKKK